MALDHIAVDQGGVAAHERFGHPVLPVHERQIVGRLDRDLEAVLAEVVGIALATAALRVLVQGCRVRLFGVDRSAAQRD